jgi:hypothetical protein
VAARWVQSTLEQLRFNDLMERIGVWRRPEVPYGPQPADKRRERSRGLRRATPARIVGIAARFLILLVAARQAFVAMELVAWGNDIGALLVYILRHVLVSTAIVLVGFAVGTWVRGLILARRGNGDAATQWIAGTARTAVLVAAFTMAIQHLGIADKFVTIAFAFAFGAICLALALAMGLGGKDIAGDLLRRHLTPGKDKPAGQDGSPSDQADDPR